MQGKYFFRIDGNLVHECSNIITTDGMHIIRTYMAGGVSDWAGALSIGASNLNAPTQSDRALEFQSIRVPVLLKSVDGNELVISGVLPSEFNGKIYEIGLYSSVVNISSDGFDDRVLVNFDETWTDSDGEPLSTSLYSNNSRLGSRSLDTSNTSIYAQSNASIDISGYSSLDNISILYNVSVVGLDRVVTLTFEDDQLPTPGSKTITITLPGENLGYQVFTTELGNLIDNNFNNVISKIIISASSDPTFAEVEIDSIRINDADETDPLFALVSRSLIGSVGGDSSSDYITKNAGVEVDIEYRVRIT
jgi:hypothetical protein